MNIFLVFLLLTLYMYLPFVICPVKQVHWVSISGFRIVYEICSDLLFEQY